MLAHKTGTLSRGGDIGIFHTPDGRAIAAAIYVTGQSRRWRSGTAGRRSGSAALARRAYLPITDALYRGFVRAAMMAARGPVRSVAANKPRRATPPGLFDQVR